jgi:lipid-A-disaccharide synthase
MSPSVMIVAGEASGDQYGARLFSALRDAASGCSAFGIGGDRMQAEGAELLFHVRDTAIMGFVEVAARFPFLRRMFATCVRALDRRRPDVVVLIDYPGFNLRLARAAKRLGVPVLYYISPQVWAWGKNRAARMRRLVDRLCVVFPFEQAIFEAAGVPTTFVGHPLLEILPDVPRDRFLARHGLPDERILALLPGSREQEIDRILPVALDAAGRLRSRVPFRTVIGASSLPDSVYSRHLAVAPDAILLRDDTHGLMQHAHAAIVTSGTATVETAYYRTPMVIVYRTSRLNYAIGRQLANVEHIGMANILAGARVVPEFLQHEVKADNIAAAMFPLMTDEAERDAMRANLARVRESMGTPGASRRTAKAVLDLIAARRSPEAPPSIRA